MGLPGKRTSIYFLNEDDWEEYQKFLFILKTKGQGFSDWVREKIKEEMEENESEVSKIFHKRQKG